MKETHNLAEFQKTAAEFALGLKLLSDRATVVGLYGDLGAGKTTFVQAVAKALGAGEILNSPTFLILKTYKLSAKTHKLLRHVDAYRLKHSDELRRLGFGELLADPYNLILIEWADHVVDILPKGHHKLFFEFVDNDTRKISQR